jgi:hypothetical protein
MVFSNGYLDRDVGATLLADEYHVINLKDLLELYYYGPQLWLKRVIEDAAAFVGLLDYWRCLERNQIWAEWVDVLEMGGVDLVDIAADRDEVEEILLEQLGAFSLDAFCHRTRTGSLVRVRNSDVVEQ